MVLKQLFNQLYSDVHVICKELVAIRKSSSKTLLWQKSHILNQCHWLTQVELCNDCKMVDVSCCIDKFQRSFFHVDAFRL